MSAQKQYREGLFGTKLGMTQVFAEDGECIPVTVVRLGPCYVLGVKDSENDGYEAVQLGFEPRKAQKSNKPELGNFQKAGKGTFQYVNEVRCQVSALGWTELGKELKVQDIFKDGELVDVTGVSIGRGFSGVVRRYKVKGQPATRGTHEYRRHIGAIGCRKFPGRVFKNKRMPGQHGNEKVTVQNLKVMSVDAKENLLLVRGAIPGAKGGLVLVKKALKNYEAPETKAGSPKVAA